MNTQTILPVLFTPEPIAFDHNLPYTKVTEFPKQTPGPVRALPAHTHKTNWLSLHEILPHADSPIHE